MLRSRSFEKSHLSNVSGVNQPGSHSGRSFSNASKPERHDRGLPTLNPSLDIKDINYHIHEKITINTAPNKAQINNTTNNYNNINLIFKDSPAMKEPWESKLGVKRPGSRDPHPTTSTGRTTQGQRDRPTGHQMYHPNTAKVNQSHTFDFERLAGGSLKKAKAAASNQSGIYQTEEPREKRSGSQEEEPRSKKLLEMMLKRLSRQGERLPSTGTAGEQAELPRGEQGQRKSHSTDRNKKKVATASLNQTMKLQESVSQSRKSSRDSSSLQPNWTTNNTYVQDRSISLNKNKNIQIRNIKIRNPLGMNG